MRRIRTLLALAAMTALAGCQTTQQAKEIKLLGFEENVAKGKSLGPIEGSDCVYSVFGYPLGGAPTLSRAIMNARKGKHAAVSDAVGGQDKLGEGARYLNNVSVSHDGFNAFVFAKQCILISATGYK